MQSLSRYSRANQVNKEWIDEYLNEAHSKGLVSVRCHCNVMAWSDDREEIKCIFCGIFVESLAHSTQFFNFAIRTKMNK